MVRERRLKVSNQERRQHRGESSQARTEQRQELVGREIGKKNLIRPVESQQIIDCNFHKDEGQSLVSFASPVPRTVSDVELTCCKGVLNKWKAFHEGY